MKITRKIKMADLVHLNHLLIPIINRFGISLGFGDNTIEYVCEQNKINTDFFLEIVNAYHDQEYFPKEHLQSFSVELIINYLTKTHQHYLNIKIPEIEELVIKMVDKCYPEQSNIKMINKFFNDYKIELHNHLKKEDDSVFPYAIKIEKAYAKKKLNEALINKMKNYSMNDFKKEHDDVEEKLFDLKNIIIKYLPSPKDNYLCYKVINELVHLENDLNNHSIIEDKVLIPKVIKMENLLINLPEK